MDCQDFFERGSLDAGVAGTGATAGDSAGAGVSGEAVARRPSRGDRLPREVWIATITQDGLEAETPKEMIGQVLARMQEVVVYEPDIVCLPETFSTANLSRPVPGNAEIAESPIGEVSAPFAEFARQYHCYVVCPVVTRREGRLYNSAVFIDREGKPIGEYHKMHPTQEELRSGISPGAIDPPVFKTDFGTVGAQICFDIAWHDGWEKLRRAGAEIVFWPSAFAGGRMVGTKAWENRYCVVSSTRKDTSRVCDITGETVARTGRWNRWVCAPVNLEKAFLHTWPCVQKLGEIQAKYGRDVVVRTFAEEEWSVIESRSPGLKVAAVMREFGLQTLEEHLAAADADQCRCR